MKKAIGFALAIILVLNLLLFALGKIHWIVFWSIIIIGAAFAYLPKFQYTR